jgi:uncharacterized repeat protein (TIGR01451 family)
MTAARTTTGSARRHQKIALTAAFAVLASLAATPHPALAAVAPACLQDGTTVTCSYSAGDNVFTVPAGVTTIHLVAIGASGGTLRGNIELVGGRPAIVSGDLTVTPGQALHAVVGGSPSGSHGGLNGGADGGVPADFAINCGSSAGGGGASDIRTNADATSRILVAAGGGGAGCEGSTLLNGGQSGGDAGAAGAPGIAIGGLAGGGGGQPGCASPGDLGCGQGGAGGSSDQAGEDGALGVGGRGGASGRAPGGGGGGGYYGGGGGGGGAGSVDGDSGGGGGGGGGSSLVPVGGTLAIDATGVPKIEISFSAPALPTGPHATLTPTSIDFGDVVVGQASSVQPVKLISSGAGDLTISAIDIAQPSDGFVASTNDCGADLLSQWSCTINVSFTPMSVGPHSATLEVHDDAADSPQTVLLTANGVGGTGAFASITPASLDFGNQATGTTSVPRTVTVTNVGTVPFLPIGQVTLPSNGFARSTCAALLEPGDSCAISVTFAPTTTGPKSAQLLILDPMPNSPQVVGLTGVGVPAVPAVHLDPTALSFGYKAVGGTSGSQTVTLSNLGTGPLAVTSAVFGGPNAADFAKAADTCSGTVVAPGSNCTISVTFSPTTRGLRSASLQFSDDAADSPHSVALSGTGVAPVASLSPSSINFGNVEIGTTSGHQTLTITNTGDSGQLLTISGTSITGVNAYDFAIASNGCLLGAVSAGASCQIQLTFTPTVAGLRSATLTVSDNAAGSPQTVGLSGTGVTPIADLAVSISASPNPVKTGSKVTYTITIFNAGPSSAMGILINDVLSSESTFVSATLSQGTCVTPVKGASGVVSCSLGSLSSGANRPIQIVVTVIAKKTSITNTATVSATTFDPNLANNTASITTRVK